MEKTHRDYMIIAIEEAKKSESGKPDDPKVGAVLIKAGYPIKSAHRGQIDKGDHAEYTLLQKLLRSTDLTNGATLYTTLEPCTSRSHDKLCCAEWIIKQGIAQVFMGILDPNPSICGRGYWRLIDAGIKVDLFPHDLAVQLFELNKNFIEAHRGQKNLTSKLASLISQRKSSAISAYPGIGWGDALSLQDCPNINEGWPVSQIRINFDRSKRFQLPERLVQPYKAYCHKLKDDKVIIDDKDKLMLAHNPIAFSDAPSLQLKFSLTKWGEIQYYRNNVATIDTERNNLIKNLINGTLEANFPNALCMHLVAITSDHKILMTKRSAKAGYDPNTWSASIEEQIDVLDLGDTEVSSAEKWARRFILEELGLDESWYHIDDFRVLSVFLESDRLNLALCANLTLSCTSETLAPILRNQPKKDYEFSDFEYMEFDRKVLISELLKPTRHYQPTSLYRLFLTFLKYFGLPKDDEID